MKTVLCLLLVFFTLHAAAESWQINKDHSEIQFKIPFMGVSNVSGRFKEFSGSFDEKNVEVIVKAESIDTANAMRDSHLRGNTFFKTKEFPDMIFKSERIYKNLKDFSAHGLLTIRNVTKPLIVVYSLSPSQKDTWGYENKFVSFKAQIKLSDYALKWNKTLPGEKFLIGDVVDLFGTFQIQPASAVTPTSKHMIPDSEVARTREKVTRGEIASPEKISVPVESNSYLNVEQKLDENPEPSTKTEVAERNTLWWVAFFTLGFLGFCSLIIVSFWIKTKYSRVDSPGYISDIIILLLGLIYSAAYAYVGWGV